MPFREQHIVHFKTLDNIKVPKIFRMVSIIIAIGVAAVFLALIFTPWVQTASGTGRVTTVDPNDRVQEINALVDGRIDTWFVREGQSVKAGEPILRIADNDPQLLERLDAEQAQFLEQRRASESALQTALIDLNRTRELFEDGLAARRDYEQARIRVEGLRADLAAAEGALTRQQVSISRQSQQLSVAPRDGTILSIVAGDSATSVSVGDPVATFLPNDAERVVEIFIDGRDVALVYPGAPVSLLFEGWPAVQFSGWPSLARGVFPGEVLAIDPAAQPNGQFRVLVKQPDNSDVAWPDERFVRFGAAVRGWVLLETVPLGYELWRRLNNFPPQFTSNGQQTTEASQ